MCKRLAIATIILISCIIAIRATMYYWERETLLTSVRNRDARGVAKWIISTATGYDEKWRRGTLEQAVSEVAATASESDMPRKTDHALATILCAISDALPNPDDPINTRVLMTASELRRSDVIAVLIEKGIDVNHHDGTGYSALLHAAEGADPEMVELLLRHHANPNDYITGHRSYTALNLARGTFRTDLQFLTNEERRRVISVLLRFGARD